jgi:hypothetical protein
MIIAELPKFSSEIFKMLETLEDRDEMSKYDSRKRLETLLTMLASFQYDLSRLRLEATTSGGPARQVYEKAILKPIANYYRTVPDGRLKTLMS